MRAGSTETAKQPGSSVKQPNSTDVYVGSRVRMRRKMVGLSQEKLGEKLGVTFQQVQKYEKGTNRIGASRLQNISRILEVPVSYFFPEQEGAAQAGFAEEGGPNYVVDFLATAEGLELNRGFARIRDAKVRRKVVDLVRTIADSEDR